MTSVGQEWNEASVPDVIRIDQEFVRSHVDQVVRQSIEQTLNGLLDAEADELCGAKRYERSAERIDTRSGHYTRKLVTKAGEVKLQVPRLRSLPFETQIIERYRRRESSVEEALVEMYLAGVSVRRVEDITEALWGTRVVPKSKVKEVAAMIKAIHAQEDRTAAREKAQAVIAKLESMRLGATAQIARLGYDETLSYMSFPREHWTRLRTNNMLEQIMREIRRRTRVVGNFPDGKSALMLVGARLRHVAGTKWGTRSYIDMTR